MHDWRRAAKALGLIVYGVSVLRAAPAQGAVWSRAYVRALPDEAFAVIEVRPDGRRVRRLPHHDAEGRVDLAHLRNAVSRLRQVKWLDPASAEQARQHLVAHGKGLSPAGRGNPEATPRRRKESRRAPEPPSPPPQAEGRRHRPKAVDRSGGGPGGWRGVSTEASPAPHRVGAGRPGR